MKHEWIAKFLEHRVADERVVRLIQKWLRGCPAGNLPRRDYLT
jgi:hypothetical protein